MRRAFILSVAIVALAATPAAAWQEVPFRALPGDDVATCLRATGPDGGLAALGPLGRRAAPTDLFALGTGAPAVRERVRFPIALGCAAVREQGGAGVAAAPVSPNGTRRVEMRAAVRDPGGTFGAPAALGPVGGVWDAAVSGRGDAVVAWVQERGGGAIRQMRVVVARRSPGGPFAPPVALTSWQRSAALAPPEIAAGVAGDGVATVVWALRSAGRREDMLKVEAASAPPGAAFGPAQLLTPRTQEVERISLAVAAGGGVLLAHESAQVIRLFERAPGAAGFGPAREIGDAANPAIDPALALRDDGAAVVAWRGEGDAVRAMTRAAGGAFGPGREVAPGHPDVGFGTGFSAFFVPRSDRAYAPLDQPGLGLRAALSAAGRVVLAWAAPRTLPDAPLAPMVATGTLDGAFGPPAALGSPARSIGGVAALVLPGGVPAVAWADNTAHPVGFGAGTLEPPTGGGRIHLARADAAAGPAAPPPAARLRAPRLQRLYPEDPIQVRVRCAAACDVRAFIADDGATSAGTAAGLTSGRSQLLRLYRTGLGDGPLPRRRGRVTVRARVSAPGSVATRTRRLRVRLARRPPLPVPPPLDARAVRRGRAIVVTWRTGFPARRVVFNVRPAAAPRVEPEAVFGRGRTRFTATLRPPRPGSVRRVVVSATDNMGRRKRQVTVPVPG